ncbi:biopolymer transporter Tol [Brachybacterium phenoliresistens]|uniref:TolB family protein n=1 Tax=Brachybacterium phenoliresistens TaxID=396014 RepID=UPI0031D92D96
MRTLRPGQRTTVLIGGPDAAEPTVVHETDEILLEAPNWTADGRLLLNGEGRLFALDLATADLAEIPFEGLPDINNDHVLHPDGEHILMSAQDGQIYRGALTGGPVEAVTEGEGGHFLHGISPDGRRIAYLDVDERWIGRVIVQDLATGARTEVPTGHGHVDGPEWTPDGAWILCSSEAFTSTPGHAQITRVRADAPHAAPEAPRPPVNADAPTFDEARGDGPQHLLTSGTVDWFPHPSPDGRWASYLSYPAGTLGHPEDRPVVVKLVELPDWSRPVRQYPVPGGQGTINVNSWAPDSTRFAFVAYPFS